MSTNVTMRRTGGLRRIATVVLAVMLNACNSTEPVDSGSNGGSNVQNVVMELSWEISGDLDVRGTTPNNGSISASSSATHPDCGHSGDDLGDSGVGGYGFYAETIQCAPIAGAYTIGVDNYSNTAIDYVLKVTRGGVALNGFPVNAGLGPDSNEGNGGGITYTFDV